MASVGGGFQEAFEGYFRGVVGCNGIADAAMFIKKGILEGERVDIRCSIDKAFRVVLKEEEAKDG